MVKRQWIFDWYHILWLMLIDVLQLTNHHQCWCSFVKALSPTLYVDPKTRMPDLMSINHKNCSNCSNCFLTCIEVLIVCIIDTHWYCFSVHCGSFHSRSWNKTITAGNTCKCFKIQLRLSIPFGWYHSYDGRFGFTTGRS